MAALFVSPMTPYLLAQYAGFSATALKPHTEDTKTTEHWAWSRMSVVASLSTSIVPCIYSSASVSDSHPFVNEAVITDL